MSRNALSGQQVADAGLNGWALLLSYGSYGLETRIHTASLAAGVDVVTAIGKLALEAHRPADLDLRPTHVRVRLVGDGDGDGTCKVTGDDLQLACDITALAGNTGVDLECRTLSHVELALDTPDWSAVGEFWAAVTGGELVAGGAWADVGDKMQARPLIWFQTSGREEPRQRWHPDIWVDPDQLQPRIDAALAAGGHLISGNAADGCTLSDPDGNKVCLATWRGRV